MSIFTEGTFNDPITQDDLEPTAGERVRATVAEAWSSMIGPSLYRWGELDEARKWGGMAFQEYDKAGAQQWIDGQGLTGHLHVEDRTYNQLELSILARRKQAELRRQYVLERTSGGVVEGAERLALSLATSLADPLTVATAFVPVVGQARYASLLEAAGSSALRRAGVRMAVGAAEGSVGQAMVEPIVYGAHQAEQADYTLYDSLANIAFGGVFGGGLHAVGGGVIDYRTGRREARVAAAGDALRARLDELAKAEGVPQRETLLHGTTEDNFASIMAAGRFDAARGARNYDYSVFGPDAVYFTTAKIEKDGGGSTWLGKTWGDRMAPYDKVIEAKLAPDARVVTISNLADAEKFAGDFVKQNPDLVDRYFQAYGFPRSDETDLEIFSRMIFADNLHEGANAAGDIAVEVSRRLRGTVDAISITRAIPSDSLPKSARGSFDMPQVAVLNPEKLSIAGKAQGTTPDTGIRSADIPDPYFDQARALEIELKRVPDVDPQNPASVSALVGRKVQSLAQFVRESGGINDVGGELSARDVTAKRAPGLIRKDATGAASVDAVRQRLFDAGYFPGRSSYNEISDSEIFDAIAEDLFQRKRYPVDVEERLLGVRDREDFLGQLEQWGIRPGMSGAEIAARLHDMDAATRVGDPPESTGAMDAEYQRVAAQRADSAAPETRESALRAVVAQDLAGDPLNVEPLFELDPATRTRPVEETLDSLRRPPQEPQPEPVPAVDAAELSAVEQQIADLDEMVRDLEADLKASGVELPEDLRADLEAAREIEEQAGLAAETARMLAACAMRYA